MEGHLKKHKVIKGNWLESRDKTLTNNIRPRYFRVKGTQLLYFENERSDSPKGSIELSEAELGDAEIHTKLPSFAIYSPSTNSTCVIFAPTSDDKKRWMQNLSTHIYMAGLRSSYSNERTSNNL